jgi:hypothetical protein
MVVGSFGLMMIRMNQAIRMPTSLYGFLTVGSCLILALLLLGVF